MKESAHTPVALIFALWIGGLCAAAQFAKISLVFPQLLALYPHAGATAGFLVSLLSFIGMLMGLFAGIIVARLGYRHLLVAALVFGAALSAFHATLPSFGMMLASRLLEGASHLVIVVVTPTMIAQITPERHRPAALTLWGTFFGVAFAIVAWFGLPLVDAYGLQALFAAHAVAMLAMAVILYAMMPRRDDAERDVSKLDMKEIIERHVIAYRSPFMSAPAMGWLFYTLGFVSILTIIPPFIEPAGRAFAVGAMPLAGIASSMTLGVFLMRYITTVNVIILGFALSAACAALMWVLPGNPWVAIALFASLGLVQGSSFAAVPQLNANPQSRAYANGALAQMGNLGNLSGTPILLMATGALGLGGLVVFALLCCAGGIAVHLFLASRRKTIPSPPPS